MSETDLVLLYTGRFERAGFTYMITGSVAGVFYGEPRVTHDVDLVLALSGRDLNLGRFMLGPVCFQKERQVSDFVVITGNCSNIDWTLGSCLPYISSRWQYATFGKEAHDNGPILQNR